MNFQPGKEFTLLTDEKFDFDLLLSPESGKEEDDDEVFLGPVGHKEKCVAVSIAINSPKKDEVSSPSPDLLTWSPLAGDKFVEIFKEAHLLALQLEKNSKHCGEKAKAPEKTENTVVEKFVAESKSKLKIFQLGNENYKSPAAIKRETFLVQDSPMNQRPPSAIKRETFFMQDSPMNQLPPSVQQCLEGPVSVANPACSVKIQAATASPVNQVARKAPGHAVSQKRSTVSPLCQKRISAVNVKKLTLSKLPPGKTATLPRKSTLLTVEKPKPGMRVSPRRRHLSSAGSSEDLQSDNTSIASDISDSSLNSSNLGLGKRTLPVPSKFGLRKPSGLKPPAANSAGDSVRKKTSSSSSSSINSSFNSSLSVSPAGATGKLNTTLNASVNRSKLQVPSNGNSRLTFAKAGIRPASSSQTSSSSSGPQKFCKSSSTGKQPHPGSIGKLTSAPLTQHQTPAKKETPRLSSAVNTQGVSQLNKPGSAVKVSSCPKPKATIAPTPTTQLKIKRRSGVPVAEAAAPKIMQPKRLLPSGSVGSGMAASTPVKPSTSKAPQTPSLGGMSVCSTFSAKRMSALPASLSRRTSGIPAMTPKTMSRSSSSPHLTCSLNNISMSSKKSSTSSKQISQAEPQVAFSPANNTSGEELSPPLVPCSLDFSFENTKSQVSQNEILKQPEGDPFPPLVPFSPDITAEKIKPQVSQEEVMQTSVTTSSHLVPCSIDCSHEEIISQVPQGEVKQQTVESNQTDEVLLIDLDLGSKCAPTLKPEDRPLIDLYNTPKKKDAPLKSVGQLIDLSSPLIRLSPEDKENIEVDTPLLIF